MLKKPIFISCKLRVSSKFHEKLQLAQVPQVKGLLRIPWKPLEFSFLESEQNMYNEMQKHKCEEKIMVLIVCRVISAIQKI